MWALGFSSLDQTAQIALVSDGKLVASDRFEPGYALSELIWDRLTTFLDTAMLKISDIDCFACVRGPGSFTGLRVMLTAVNGIAFAMNRAVLGFTVDELTHENLDGLSGDDLAARAALFAARQESSQILQGYQGPVMPEYGASFTISGRRV